MQNMKSLLKGYSDWNKRDSLTYEIYDRLQESKRDDIQ